jgi:hypothetical protein
VRTKKRSIDHRAPPALCEWCVGLPAGAIAAPTARATTGAAAHLSVTIAAIDRLVTARLERHTRLAAAIRADGSVHLTWSTLAAISSGHGGLTRRAALRTTRGSVCQPFAGIKLLLACREHEVTAAIAAPECLIGGQNSNPLSGPATPLAPGPTRPHINGADPILGKRCREAAGIVPKRGRCMPGHR